MTPRELMEHAVKIGKKSVVEQGRADDPPPFVGAVLARDGELLACAHRGQTGIGDHAEFGVIKHLLASTDLSGTTLYTTLEPCTIRGPEKTPCLEHIVGAGVAHVVIGLIDPNRDIQGDGYWLLREKGIAVSFFDSDLIYEIQKDNDTFIKHHRPLVWLPPASARSLDDWYFIVNSIYLDRNQQRSPTWLFSHLVEMIGGLSLLVTNKNKPGISLERFLAKCFAWWFALCNSARLRSVESLVWNKYPGVCSYCHFAPHQNRPCAIAKSKDRNPDWPELSRLADVNRSRRPRTLKDWKQMFYRIYPPSQGESYDPRFPF